MVINPCDVLERPRVQPGPPCGLSAQIRRLLQAMDAQESLWPADDTERAGRGLGVTSGTFYGNLRAAGLAPAGVHILRHVAAKLRRDAGESVEDVSRFLDHSSLQVATVDLRRLEGQEDRSYWQVAAAIGGLGLASLPRYSGGAR